MKKIFNIILLFSIFFIYAQNNILIDEDLLFSDSQLDNDVNNIKSDANLMKDIIEFDKLKIGGLFKGELDFQLYLSNLFSENDVIYNNDINPILDLDIFIEARPNYNIKYYNLFKVSYKNNFKFKIFELFVDFNWKDNIYFRFGKHTINTGVGLFWNPTNILNIDNIDLLKPFDDIEGPISLRINIPIKNKQSNILFYSILPNYLDNFETIRIENIAFAMQYNFLLYDYEIMIGGFYRYDFAPKLFMSFTGSIWKFGIFGECITSWGSDIDYITNIFLEPPYLNIEKYSDKMFFSGTMGFIYNNSNINLSLTFQYFYNGYGYNEDKKSEIIEKTNKYYPYEDDMLNQIRNLVQSNIYQRSKHYLGFYFQKQHLFHQKINLSSIFIFNISDISGIIQPSIIYNVFDYFTIEFTTKIIWTKNKNTEYSFLSNNNNLSFTIKVNFATGKY